ADFVGLAARLRYPRPNFPHEEEMGLQTLPPEAQAQDIRLPFRWHSEYREAFVQGAQTGRRVRQEAACTRDRAEEDPSRNIVEMLHLDTSDAKEQAVANALIQRFDRDHFQRLRLELVVDANVSFRQPEHCQLRHIFEYLNPSVAATNALHIPRVFVIALIPIFTIFFFFFFFLLIMLFHMDRTYRRPVLQCWTQPKLL
ncbi:hypothetical protein BFJ67_g17583, partial [Fusarium oxysporum f. sp. cepae]